MAERSRSRSRSREREREKRRTVYKGLEDEENQEALEALKRNEDRIRKFLGYTNADNPFGDYNLSEQFIWKKKYDKTKDGNSSPLEDLPKTEAERKQRRFLEEIEQVKRKRAERELEKAKLEEEKNRMQRERENETYESWLEKERKFHLEQAKVRAEIRIKNGREAFNDAFFKISQIYKGLNPFEPKLEVVMDDPLKLLNSMGLNDLKEMKTEQEAFIALEEGQPYQTFWQQLLLLVEDKIQHMEAEQNSLNKHFAMGGVAADEEYAEEIKQMFDGKTLEELNDLQKQIQDTLANPEFKIDAQYWDKLLKRLKIFKAKRVLKDYHLTYQKEKKELQRDLQEVLGEGSTTQAAPKEAQPHSTSRGPRHRHGHYHHHHSHHVERETKEIVLPPDEEGALSPLLISFDAEDKPDAIVPERDRALLQEQRGKILHRELQRIMEKIKPHLRIPPPPPLDSQPIAVAENEEVAGEDDPGTTGRKQPSSLTEARRQRLVSSEAIGVDHQENEEITKQIVNFEKSRPDQPFEEKFDDFVAVKRNYEWIDKYRPRKPQYFNRVKLGYEWNKYNQTHYDHDNPPPKVVQGYKFNIFYPDLIDKTQTPQYFLEPLETPEFCLIRFHAGPPYLDIAFKIISKQWEFSDKHGFKCVFERGILHLYFNFQKARYRR